MMFERACLQCGKVKFFFPSELKHSRTGPRLYCSNICRAETNAKWEVLGCRWCGGDLKRRYRKFCSPKCRGEYQSHMKIPKGDVIGSDPIKKLKAHSNRKESYR